MTAGEAEPVRHSGQEIRGTRRIPGGHGGGRARGYAIYSGNSAPMKLKFDELKQFQDKKGQRRQRFSRAYKQVDRLEVSAA
jgi:hypothetical protein